MDGQKDTFVKNSFFIIKKFLFNFLNIFFQSSLPFYMQMIYSEFRLISQSGFRENPWTSYTNQTFVYYYIDSFPRHNEDGSYSYGYEAADGSFKLETRFPDGRVKGKYGYVDIHTGKLKVNTK